MRYVPHHPHPNSIARTVRSQKTHHSPSFSFLVLISVLIAEACSAYPVAGGAYNIVSRRGGRFIGWQTGWWI